jgi:hypothetical protein
MTGCHTDMCVSLWPLASTMNGIYPHYVHDHDKSCQSILLYSLNLCYKTLICVDRYSRVLVKQVSHGWNVRDTWTCGACFVRSFPRLKLTFSRPDFGPCTLPPRTIPLIPVTAAPISGEFSSTFALLQSAPQVEGQSDEIPIQLDNTPLEEFEALLDMIYPHELGFPTAPTTAA